MADKDNKAGGGGKPAAGIAFKELILSRIEESVDTKEALMRHAETIEAIARLLVRVYRSGGKVFLFGNGGSAADAQHIAAELSGKFYLERQPLPAEALNVNTSAITAIGNDYSFEMVFARQLEASGRKGDVAIGISTSGNSKNIIEALKIAGRKEMATVALTGRDGGELKKFADLRLSAPSDDTARIQECHILVGHIVCELVERELFGG